MLAAAVLWAKNVAHLSFVDLPDDESLNTLSAVEVLTTTQEDKFVTEQVSATDPAVMLLHVERTLEGQLCLVEDTLK